MIPAKLLERNKKEINGITEQVDNATPKSAARIMLEVGAAVPLVMANAEGRNEKNIFVIYRILF